MKKLTTSIILIIIFVLNFTMSVFADDTPINYTDYVSEENLSLYNKFKGQNLTINVYNWGEYIPDGSDESLNINKVFEEITGIKVVYSTFATNEELYAKLKGGSVSYDIIIPSDYMIGQMIEENMLLPLNYSNIPNAKNIMDKFRGLDYDSEDKYSVPYTWGLVGIFYNTSLIDEEIDSWEVFWDDKYSKNMLMFSNPRDAFAISQRLLGYSFNSENIDEWKTALEKLKEQKPLMQDYVMDEIFDKMAGEEAAIAPYYSGDAKVILEENENIKFVYPKEGTNMFVDAVCIPSSSKNKEAAELYINFLAEPQIAYEVTSFIGYATPNKEAFELLDDEVKNDPLFYPSEEVLENTEVFKNLPSELNSEISTMWTELRNASSKQSDENDSIVFPVILIIIVILMFVLILYKRRKKIREDY